MRKHYGFSEAEYSSLLNNGVTIKQLFDSSEIFMVSKYTKYIPISEICLYYFIDQTSINPFSSSDPPSKIFIALFNQLDFVSKMDIKAYIKFMGV